MTLIERYELYERTIRDSGGFPLNFAGWLRIQRDSIGKWEGVCCCPAHRSDILCLVHGAPSPALRDFTSPERKAAPLHIVMAEYFPDALMAIARLSKKANDKHNPGERVHWSRGKSNDHLDCAARHILTPDRVDPETGEQERVAAGWRLLADIQLAEEKRLVAAGIRPLSGVVE